MRALAEHFQQSRQTSRCLFCQGQLTTRGQAVRLQSSSAGPKPSADVGKVQRGLKEAGIGSAAVASSARKGASQASNALYQRLPSQVPQCAHTGRISKGEGQFQCLVLQVKHLLASASQPGSVQKVMKLQLEAFWGRHGRKVLALGGVLVVYALWYSTIQHRGYQGV